MKKQLMASLVLAAGLAVLVSGCSSDEPEPKSTQKPTPSPTATAPEVRYNECVDGKATVLASDVEKGGSFELGDCAEVSVVGAANPDSTIKLGAVTLLVVEADAAVVHAGTVERIVVPGSHNEITHAGDAAVDDQGTDNEVTVG